MQELQNSVSTRYGAGIDAGLYLQKFVTLTMRLQAHLNGGQGTRVNKTPSEQYQ
jgi:leucyl aminopeptidase